MHSSSPGSSATPAEEAEVSASNPPSLARHIFFGADGLRAGWSILLFLTIFCLLLALCGLDARQLFLPSTTPHRAAPRALQFGASAFYEGITTFCIAVPTLLLSRIERRPLRAYGLGLTPRALTQFSGGLAWGTVLLSLLVTSLSLAHLLVFTGRQLSGIAILRFGTEWLFTFLLVAFFEESCTRGYLLFTVARGIAGTVRVFTASENSRAIGFWIAAAFLSFVFGLSHTSNAGESPLGLLSAGLIGLVFCLSLWRTGSLWWAIGFHAAWDWAQSFLFGVADSGSMIAVPLLGSHPQGTPLLSGGLTGPEGSLLVLPTTALIVAVIVLTLRRAVWPASRDQTPSLDPG